MTDEEPPHDQQPTRPAPAGLDVFDGQVVTLHLTGAGRVKSLTGELTSISGDGLRVVEDDGEWWVPREHIQAVQRPSEQPS